MLVTAFKKFADNTEYVDPIGKAPHDLLSTKEKIKGRYLPWLAHVSSFALSFSLTGMQLGVTFTSLLVATIASAGVLGGSLAQYQKSQALHKAEELFYNFNKKDQRDDFSSDFPHHKTLPSIINIISKEGGLRQAPILHVTSGNPNASISMGNHSFLDKKDQYLINVDEFFIRSQPLQTLLFASAHETAHAIYGDLSFTRINLDFITRCMHVISGVALMFTSGPIAGLIYGGASLAFNTVAHAKENQYRERRCDRFALQKTGAGAAAADVFTPLAVSSFFEGGIKRTWARMTQDHPPSELRAQYCAEFENRNTKYCKQRRTTLRYLAKASR